MIAKPAVCDRSRRSVMLQSRFPQTSLKLVVTYKLLPLLLQIILHGILYGAGGELAEAAFDSSRVIRAVFVSSRQRGVTSLQYKNGKSASDLSTHFCPRFCCERCYNRKCSRRKNLCRFAHFLRGKKKLGCQKSEERLCKFQENYSSCYF